MKIKLKYGFFLILHDIFYKGSTTSTKNSDGIISTFRDLGPYKYTNILYQAAANGNPLSLIPTDPNLLSFFSFEFLIILCFQNKEKLTFLFFLIGGGCIPRTTFFVPNVTTDF